MEPGLETTNMCRSVSTMVGLCVWPSKLAILTLCKGVFTLFKSVTGHLQAEVRPGYT